MEVKKTFPFEIRELEPKLSEEIMKSFTGQQSGFVRVGPKGYFFPYKYKEEALNMYTIPIKPTDVFVTSYPRSGTTWTQELVWMVANDLDYNTSAAIPLLTRYQFIEYSVYFNSILKKRLTERNSENKTKLQFLDQIMQPGTEMFAKKASPRFVKTHLPMSLLPPTLLNVAKVIYVARDPRDVAVSFYYLNKTMRYHGFTGDFKMYWKYFINDLYIYMPYFEHLKEAWAKRNHPNMLFLFYEELSKDLPAAIRRVANFFNKRFDEEQISRLCQHLSIERFRNNKSVNSDVLKDLGILRSDEEPFIRKGQCGGWRDYFDEEMAQQAERWIQDNLRDSDLCFPHLKK